MARGSSQATGAATQAQNLSTGLEGNASSLYSAVAPELMTEAAHPGGYAPADMAAMDTAAQESSGGTQAAAQGQGALRASRTKNAGTADAAIAESARGAGREAAHEAVGTRVANAGLKQKQQQAGLGGLESLFGTNVSGGIGALGQVAPNVNANTNAANQSWDWAKYLLDPAMAAAGSAKYPGT